MVAQELSIPFVWATALREAVEQAPGAFAGVFRHPVAGCCRRSLGHVADGAVGRPYRRGASLRNVERCGLARGVLRSP